MYLAAEISRAYAELELPPGAGLEQVKAAYRRLARACHPDLNPGALSEAMARLNRAYQLILDYLRSRRAASQPGVRPFVFQEFAGAGGFRARQARRAYGTAPDASPHSPSPDSAARDTHAEHPAPAVPASSPEPVLPRPLAGPVPLPRQAGQGWRLVGLARRKGEIVYLVEVSGRPRHITLPVRCATACPHCQGRGHHHRRRCPDCNGRGWIARAQNLTVALPRRWRHGHTFRVPACTAGEQLRVELREVGRV